MRDDTIWVVEMFHAGVWNPTVGVSISRADGRIELRDWKQRNPSDKFRLRRYIRWGGK